MTLYIAHEKRRRVPASRLHVMPTLDRRDVLGVLSRISCERNLFEQIEVGRAVPPIDFQNLAEAPLVATDEAFLEAPLLLVLRPLDPSSASQVSK